MKRFCITIFTMVFILILFISCTIDLSNLQPILPGLNEKPNSVYRGVYSIDNTPVGVVLDVTLNDGSINKIEIIEHNGSPIGKKAEKIIDSIIKKQSLDVDVISGATVSSKAILMAVENALQ